MWALAHCLSQVLWLEDPGTVVVVTGDGMAEALPHAWLNTTVREELSPRIRAGHLGMVRMPPECLHVSARGRLTHWLGTRLPPQGIVSFLRRCDTRIRHVVAADPDTFALWTTYAFGPEGGSMAPPVPTPGSRRGVSAAEEGRLHKLVDHHIVAGSAEHVTCVAFGFLTSNICRGLRLTTTSSLLRVASAKSTLSLPEQHKFRRYLQFGGGRCTPGFGESLSGNYADFAVDESAADAVLQAALAVESDASLADDALPKASLFVRLGKTAGDDAGAAASPDATAGASVAQQAAEPAEPAAAASEAAQATAEAAPEPVREPVPESAPEKMAEPTPEPTPEPAPEPTPEPTPVPTPEPAREPEPVAPEPSTASAAAEPAAELQPAPVAAPVVVTTQAGGQSGGSGGDGGGSKAGGASDGSDGDASGKWKWWVVAAATAWGLLEWRRRYLCGPCREVGGIMVRVTDPQEIESYV